MNLFIGEITQVVKDYDGGFEKNTGDGIMAYFGTESDDTAEMTSEAISAATWMLYALDNHINPILKDWKLPQIRCRIGIDMGEVFLARIGVPDVNTLVAIGPSANNAFRLQRKAGVNGIAISGGMYRALPQQMKSWCEARYEESIGGLFVSPSQVGGGSFLDLLGAPPVSSTPQVTQTFSHYAVTHRTSL